MALRNGVPQRLAPGSAQVSPVRALSTGPSPCPSVCEASPECRPAGSSAQNGSALKREFSGGSYNAKWQPMPSPSEGSLSSGGMDQGSDAPARDFDGEVSGVWAASASDPEKSCVEDLCPYRSDATTSRVASAAARGPGYRDTLGRRRVVAVGEVRHGRLPGLRTTLRHRCSNSFCDRDPHF